MPANERPKQDPSHWRQQAACRTYDTAIFFPATRDAVGRKRALAICASCTVRHDCLEDLLSMPATFGYDAGIRAGLTAIGIKRARAHRKAARRQAS